MPAGRLRASARQLFPPIAWREEKLAERTAEVRRLRAELRRSVTAQQYAEAEAERLRLELAALRNRITETRAALQRPSWQRSLDDLRRNVVTLRSVDREKAHPLRQLPFKLRNYRLALSHGVPAPRSTPPGARSTRSTSVASPTSSCSSRTAALAGTGCSRCGGCPTGVSPW